MKKNSNKELIRNYRAGLAKPAPTEAAQLQIVKPQSYPDKSNCEVDGWEEWAATHPGSALGTDPW